MKLSFTIRSWLTCNINWPILHLHFTKKYFAENVSHFQNRFIYLLEVIEILRHDIKQQKSDIKKLQAYPTPKLRDQVSRIHLRLRNDVAIFFDLYLEVKIDFSDFLA